MARALKILVVDDEPTIRLSLRESLSNMGYDVLDASDGLSGLALIESENPDIVLLDIRMPGLDGISVLREVQSRRLGAAIVIISAHGNMSHAVEAMRLGAVDYIQKPFKTAEVKLMVARVTSKLELEREAQHHRKRAEQQYNLQSIVGVSPAVLHWRALIAQIATSDATNILIEGESGTGKGLISRVIHQMGRRQRKPLIEVSCTALPGSLIESELFGHERGAFTDAKERKQGLFETADGGSIFLDEIGDMPPRSQAALLRVLEDRAFKRVGSTRDVHVDVQVIAATNRDLAEDVNQNLFRKDLYYRLAVLRVQLTPLRSRPEDILPLCDHFIAHFNREFRRNYEGVSPAAAEILLRHSWPGNTRELRNFIERAMILWNERELQPEHLPAELTTSVFPEVPLISTGTIPPSDMSIPAVERQMLEQALEKTGGNQTKAARLLGITRDTLRYRIKKHRLTDAERSDGE